MSEKPKNQLDKKGSSIPETEAIDAPVLMFYILEYKRTLITNVKRSEIIEAS
jgi:hypothetical protein